MDFLLSNLNLHMFGIGLSGLPSEILLAPVYLLILVFSYCVGDFFEFIFNFTGVI